MKKLNALLLTSSLIISQESFSQNVALASNMDDITLYTASQVHNILDRHSEKKWNTKKLNDLNVSYTLNVNSETQYYQNVEIFKQQLLDTLSIHIEDFKLTLISPSHLGIERWALAFEKNIDINQRILPWWTGKLIIGTWETISNHQQIFIQTKINF